MFWLVVASCKGLLLSKVFFCCSEVLLGGNSQQSSTLDGSLSPIPLSGEGERDASLLVGGGSGPLPKMGGGTFLSLLVVYA